MPRPPTAQAASRVSQRSDHCAQGRTRRQRALIAMGVQARRWDEGGEPVASTGVTFLPPLSHSPLSGGQVQSNLDPQNPIGWAIRCSKVRRHATGARWPSGTRRNLGVRPQTPPWPGGRGAGAKGLPLCSGRVRLFHLSQGQPLYRLFTSFCACGGMQPIRPARCRAGLRWEGWGQFHTGGGPLPSHRFRQDCEW